jgi:hypothetical protein
MTCREHRELEQEREDARRDLEGLPAETPASSPAPAEVDELDEDVLRIAGYLAVDIEPLEPGAEWPAVPLNLRGGR